MTAIRHTITWSYEDRHREDMRPWTAPKDARCGQMCVLYEAERGEWVAIGRMASDSIRAYEGDQKYWGWVQWRKVYPDGRVEPK